ncbi:hypothetical protein [Prosthecobacter sp.]|uniref:hypothetical protein n=1 Tax=Prosthecobacter sp. TaxID=1965333 RepID=UPI002489B5C0|nr:hypothetical protein [Prosthecobacter sp.]MDI1314599.1 hypothetical protein [Prosthecobacter sp.]
MPQFTIDLPEAVMPALTRKAQGWNQSPEGFLSAYVVTCLENDEYVPADAEHQALEDILEERDKGPFITITDMKAYRESIRARVMERVQQHQHA